LLKMLKKKVAMALCLALVLALVPQGVYAAQAMALVSVRVEGAEETLFFDYGVVIAENTSVLELLLALDIGVEYNENDMGAWLTEILGLEDDVEHSWMYAVNNELPDVSVDAFMLQDGDELVVYFLNWQNASYAFFTPSIVEVLTNEAVELQLMTYEWGVGASPVAGALLSIVSDSPTDRMFRYTDEDGRVELSFMHPGRFYVSASLNGSISRPMSLWLVGAAEPELWVDQYSRTVWYGANYIVPEVIFSADETAALMLPFREVVEHLLGGSVYWNGESRRVSAQFGDKNADFSIEDAEVTVHNSRVFVPFEAFMDLFE